MSFTTFPLEREGISLLKNLSTQKEYKDSASLEGSLTTRIILKQMKMNYE